MLKFEISATNAVPNKPREYTHKVMGYRHSDKEGILNPWPANFLKRINMKKLEIFGQKK